MSLSFWAGVVQGKGSFMAKEVRVYHRDLRLLRALQEALGGNLGRANAISYTLRFSGDRMRVLMDDLAPSLEGKNDAAEWARGVVAACARTTPRALMLKKQSKAAVVSKVRAIVAEMFPDIHLHGSEGIVVVYGKEGRTKLAEWARAGIPQLEHPDDTLETCNFRAATRDAEKVNALRQEEGRRQYAPRLTPALKSAILEDASKGLSYASIAAQHDVKYGQVQKLACAAIGRRKTPRLSEEIRQFIAQRWQRGQKALSIHYMLKKYYNRPVSTVRHIYRVVSGA